MKLATLRNNQRDGVLYVVSKDLQSCVSAKAVCATMQDAMDNWAEIEPKLQMIYNALNAGTLDAEKFDQSATMSPLPRAYQWADGSAYVNHVVLVRRARGAEVPDSFWHDPLMYQGGSDRFIGSKDDILVADTAFGIDFEAEIAVITGDVAMAATPEEAGKEIRLFMLVNDVSLRGLIPAELAKGFGFFQSKPASAFSPVAITPDELDGNYTDGRVHLPLLSTLNGTLFGEPNAGVDMTFNFPQLVAHAAKTRELGAGCVIGSGTISNAQDTEHGSAISDGGVGYSCIAEVRMIETINNGAPSTNFMQFGDRIRIEMNDKDGNSLFGSIEQKVVQYQK